MRLKYKEGYKTHHASGRTQSNSASFAIRLEKRTTKGSSSGRILCLVPVFVLEMHNQANYKMFAQVRPDG